MNIIWLTLAYVCGSLSVIGLNAGYHAYVRSQNQELKEIGRDLLKENEELVNAFNKISERIEVEAKLLTIDILSNIIKELKSQTRGE